MEQIDVRPKEPVRELVLRQVWGTGGFGNGSIIGRCFVRKPCANFVKNVEVFSR